MVKGQMQKGLTLTELLVATILIGIVMTGVVRLQRFYQAGPGFNGQGDHPRRADGDRDALSGRRR